MTEHQIKQMAQQTKGEQAPCSPPLPPPPPPPPPPLHQSDADEDDENVRQLKECSPVYLSLQDCLVQTNRDWKSCQKEVQALKDCYRRSKT